MIEFNITPDVEICFKSAELCKSDFCYFHYFGHNIWKNFFILIRLGTKL
jgi:hypothetical protein